MAIPETGTEELVDFETALADPSAYCADPEAIVTDTELTLDQKRRFLTEWSQDVTDRQQAAEEGMDISSANKAAAEGELLRRIHKSLEELKGQTEAEGRMAAPFRRRRTPL